MLVVNALRDASTTEEPDVGIPHVGGCAGGHPVMGVPTVRRV